MTTAPEEPRDPHVDEAAGAPDPVHETDGEPRFAPDGDDVPETEPEDA